MKKIFLVLLIITMAFVGCGKNEEPEEQIDIVEEVPEDVIEEEEEEEIDEFEGMAMNPLTGLYIDEEAANRRPIGIMINNHGGAIPQSGIMQADVFYETVVEGGITRLLALYQDFDSEKIGPIRSARHYFLEYAFDHDAIYVHHGQSPQAQAAFSQLNTPNFNGMTWGGIMNFIDSTRVAPNSTYTSYERLMNTWEETGYRQEISEDLEPKFRFYEEETDLNSDIVANEVTLPFSGNTTYTSNFSYDEDLKLYKRYHRGGQPHIERETEEQLEFKNIIVQYTSTWLIPGDTAGRLDQDLISNGKGYYITNGEAIEITWEKTAHRSATQYYDEEGNELLMNKGKTWIAVFPDNREIILE
ncbi:DUF3048 family protein [Natranaerovirga hydrolytica]|uniref:DUF3048 family protein n=1 Tax=Natranaerovirga hydrolytica TaxID=680378 RepID=A0A4R1MY92_9FIRM|nr:DUF3048 domain-containing protein [Natranaerovirga hydrolytica]TCK98247.1 DUF3048 family protein [Natranaerovirga hydrolytica]